MRKILLGLLIAALSFKAPAASQSQAAPGVLIGRVVSGSGSEVRPVRRAKVTLTGGAGAARVTDTDVKGEYRFDLLARGAYKLTVEKPGFVKFEAPASPNATLTMTRGGAIEGVVIDPNGDPVWSVVVAALEPQPAGAKPKVVAEARTDDRGQYRLHSLPEGSYLVEARVDASFAVSSSMQPRDVLGSRAYFPDAAEIDAAKPVVVSLGRDTAAVDITLGLTSPMKDLLPAPPAPSRPEATGTARIAGRVLDAASGKPIKNAQLLLVPVEGQPVNQTRTDARGRFAYTSLEARRYTLRAEAPHYVPLEFGQQRPGERGTQIDVRDGVEFAAEIKLPRVSAVEGTLLDEFGDPAPNVTIQAAQRLYANGRRRLVPLSSRVPSPVTDDQGHYRLGGLAPGDYYLTALSGASTGAGEVGAFAPTYYPGTSNSGAAAPVRITLGVDATAAFSLVPVRTLSISGVMVDADGRPLSGQVTLWLASADRLDGGGLNLNRGTTITDGRFVIRNVPQGSYTLQGYGPGPAGWTAPPNPLRLPFGSVALTIGDADLDGVVLKVTDGTSLRGKIALEDASVAPPSPSEISVMTTAVEADSSPGSIGAALPAQIQADLTFELTKQSGRRRFFVNVSSLNWTLRKITLNELDITDSPIDLGTKDVEGVEIVLSPKVSRITGGVSDDKGPVGDYSLVIFPSDPTKWIVLSRFMRLVRPMQQGRFDVRGLPPEDYLIIALPTVVGAEWVDPEFLQQLRGQATPFVLTEGESRTLDLKLKKRP